jgi:hypothetical protein
LKFPPYDANEEPRSKWTDSFAEFVIAKIILELRRLEVVEVSVYWDKFICGIAETKCRKKESKPACLVLLSTMFNISYLLVDNSYQKSSEKNCLLKDKMKTEE